MLCSVLCLKMLSVEVVEELKYALGYIRQIYPGYNPILRAIKGGCDDWNTCHCGVTHCYRYEIECDKCFDPELYVWNDDSWGGLKKQTYAKTMNIKPSMYLNIRDSYLTAKNLVTSGASLTYVLKGDPLVTHIFIKLTRMDDELD